MGPANYISSFDDLQKWFELQACVKWNLYRGFHERMPERSILHKQREEQLSATESWVLLQDIITMNSMGGGKFTLFVPTYGAAKGSSVFFGINLASPNAHLAPGLAGFQGAHSQLPGAVGMIQADEVARRIESALKEERMSRRIEELEAAADAKDNLQDVLLQKVLEIDPDKALAAVGNIFQRFIQPAAQVPVTMRGLNQEDNPMDPELPQNNQFEIDGNLISPALNTIAGHFTTEDDFVTFINNVALQFDQNPQLYINMINGAPKQ